MSNSNAPVESDQKVITCSKAKQDNQLAKIVDQNQIDAFKVKRSGKIKENLVDNKQKGISNPFPAEQELDDTLQLDDSSLDKTLINDQSISSENSSKTSGFHSNFCPNLSIMTGSSNQDQTLTNELSYFNESNLLSSTVITIDNKTLKEKLKTSLARDSIISNNDCDDEKSDTELSHKQIGRAHV